MRDPKAPLTVWEKASLLTRVWITYGRVVVGSKRPLPAQVQALRKTGRVRKRPLPPIKVSRAIHLGLRAGSLSPRCLPNALVMFRILRQQGDSPVLVIGLPADPKNHIAHAWIELDGRDVGPPPGRGNHEELARYG